ncbi:LysR family transcriptional regulator [Temperatibacter marinus]|uniref:LysR family transcriptional regulator n=1 Tax=Temperatibacter marinus TaxID=1456591 RepID=A0AA52EFG4_9PROT|nr:LysR family transcriptional regulator [Temperatibacter marinus]WND03811.1 LysR family transcriptional regulator [Temperatibacter marinus]
MNWNDLKIFLAVSDASSIREAAKKLKVSHSKVSRHIDALEAASGVKLFDRLSIGYRLTAAGEELIPIARDMETRVHSYCRMVAGRDDILSGVVTVTCPEVLVTPLLLDYFLAFMREYPAIQVKISTSYELFDLSKREADVAFRITHSPPEHLIGRKIGDFNEAVYAMESYMMSHRPTSKESSARWIGWGEPEEHPSWIASSPFPHLPIMGHFNNPSIQCEIAERGEGLGFFPCCFVKPDSRLKKLSTPKNISELWMLSHKDLRSSKRLRAFKDFMTRHIPEIKSKLEGHSL